MKILIRAYGSHLMGMGHLYRVKKLVKKLREHKMCEILLITRSFSESRGIYLQIDADKIIELPNDVEETDELTLLQSFQENEFDICINDQLDTNKNTANELNKISKKSITFDDRGTGVEAFSHIINVLYPSQKNLIQERNSYKYLIINDYKSVKDNYKLQTNVKTIFINQGAADTWGAIPDMIDELSLLPYHFKLVVVLGPSFKHYDELSKALKYTTKKIELYNYVDSIVEIVQSCDLAILGAGNTLFEVASIGVPVIASTREEKELITIKRLLEGQLIFSTNEIYQKGNLNSMVEMLMKDSDHRSKTSERCKKSFTYHGLENILQIVLEESE